MLHHMTFVSRGLQHEDFQNRACVCLSLHPYRRGVFNLPTLDDLIIYNKILCCNMMNHDVFGEMSDSFHCAPQVQGFQMFQTPLKF